MRSRSGWMEIQVKMNDYLFREGETFASYAKRLACAFSPSPEDVEIALVEVYMPNDRGWDAPKNWRDPEIKIMWKQGIDASHAS